MTTGMRRPGAKDGPKSLPPLPTNASVGKRWRFRRNLVIYVAHQKGLSQRLLADVFDLPRSTIAGIVKEFAKYEGGQAPPPES